MSFPQELKILIRTNWENIVKNEFGALSNRLKQRPTQNEFSQIIQDLHNTYKKHIFHVHKESQHYSLDKNQIDLVQQYIVAIERNFLTDRKKFSEIYMQQEKAPNRYSLFEEQIKQEQEKPTTQYSLFEERIKQEQQQAKFPLPSLEEQLATGEIFPDETEKQHNQYHLCNF